MGKARTGLFALAAAAALGFAAGQSVSDLEKDLARARDEDKASLWNKMAAARAVNSPRQSLEDASRALALAETYRLPAEAVAARLNMAAAILRLGRPQDASAEYARALAGAERSGDEDRAAAALHGLGNAGFYAGAYAEARDFYLRALAIRERRSDRAGMAKTLNNLGNIAAHQSDAAGAARYYRRALEMSRELGDRQGQALALNNLGLIEKDHGSLDRALENYLEAARIEEELGDLRGQAMAAVNIAILHGRLDDPVKTEAYAREALALYRRLGDDRGLAAALDTWAGALVKQGKHTDALLGLREAAALKEKVGDLKGLADALGNIGNCLEATGDDDQALDHFERCLALVEKIRFQEGIARTLKSIGDIHVKRRDLARAEEFLVRSLKMSGPPRPETLLLGEIHLSLSELYRSAGRWRDAYDHLRLHGRIRERVVAEDSRRRIAEMQVRFETERKEKELTLLGQSNRLLQQDNEIQKLRLARQRLFAFAAAAVLLAVLAAGGILFKKYLYLLAFWRRKSSFGHFRIVEQISAGGMGIVYRATRVMDPRRPLALKVLREEYSGDAVLRRRFKNEAALIDQLNHPHIVKVYERGEHTQRLYIAMELLEGCSLADLIRAGRRLSLPEGLDVMRQLAETLAQVHAKGIVHRDLKPENIMLIEKDGIRNFVKLLDFDIASNPALTRLTEAGQILGTVSYLPPEQIAGQPATAAGDVYSLGVVFYEMLTLEKPFQGEAPIDVVRRILADEPVAPAARAAALPRELNDLILLMMNKRPALRPTDEALTAAIRNVSRQVGG